MTAGDVDVLVRRAAVVLRAGGVENADHDAAVLLAHVCGVTRTEIDRARLLGKALPALVRDGVDSVLRDFAGVLRRRASREPLQTIVGHAPFRSLEVEVGPGVFIPRPETEVVVQTALDWIVGEGIYGPRVVDLCTGTGAIGLSVAVEVPGAEVWAVELSERSAAWAERNHRRVSGSHPGVAYAFHLVRGDATSPATLASLDASVDVVISNPPYIPENRPVEQPEVRDHDPRMALYGGSADGSAIPERIVDRAVGLLRHGGLLVMEHDVTQGDQLAAYALAHGFERARTGRDWSGRPRELVAQRA
ncbi:peptide chain release factor N(5)-glutamine methyltransferase [uncultured Bifidobacterium sp.]|uniref:peptide chain release factor N(5)-glutamine methyltransferase n=1 Tax=uncultured Bifidobacterium sp. TaxID=165187 RepID=UPI0037DC1CF3